jgi:uncharacterized Fe-S center protein
LTLAVVDFAVVRQDFGDFDANDGTSKVRLEHGFLDDMKVTADIVELESMVGGNHVICHVPDKGSGSLRGIEVSFELSSALL